MKKSDLLKRLPKRKESQHALNAKIPDSLWDRVRKMAKETDCFDRDIIIAALTAIVEAHEESKNQK